MTENFVGNTRDWKFSLAKFSKIPQHLGKSNFAKKPNPAKLKFGKPPRCVKFPPLTTINLRSLNLPISSINSDIFPTPKWSRIQAAQAYFRPASGLPFCPSLATLTQMRSTRERAKRQGAAAHAAGAFDNTMEHIRRYRMQGVALKHNGRCSAIFAGRF